MLLLAGYVYAHALTKWLHGHRHVALHVGLFRIVAVVALPIHIAPRLPSAAVRTPPVWSLLSVLVPSVALPCVALAASGPLLHVWFARESSSISRRSIFLYSASNLGSLVGLLAYPVLIEPLFPIAGQDLDLGGCVTGLFVALVIVCGVVVPARGRTGDADELPTAVGQFQISRVRLLLLAFAPASLTLGITTSSSPTLPRCRCSGSYLLALYFVSIRIGFAARPVIPHRLALQLLPPILLVVVSLYLFGFDDPWWLSFRHTLSCSSSRH